MRVSERFTLTRGEQRLVIVLVLGLVIAAAATKWIQREPVRPAKATTTTASPPPVEDESPNEEN